MKNDAIEITEAIQSSTILIVFSMALCALAIMASLLILL